MEFSILNIFISILLMIIIFASVCSIIYIFVRHAVEQNQSSENNLWLFPALFVFGMAIPLMCSIGLFPSEQMIP